jgi:hypothetical protein
MTSSDGWKKTVRLNKLLGMWAAEKLGITGRHAEAYSDALAVGTLDPERSDVLAKFARTLTLLAWPHRMNRSCAS